MKLLGFLSEKQKIEAECLRCYGLEVDKQLWSGDIVMVKFSNSDDGLHVAEEVYIRSDGSKVYRYE